MIQSIIYDLKLTQPWTQYDLKLATTIAHDLQVEKNHFILICVFNLFIRHHNVISNQKNKHEQYEHYYNHSYKILVLSLLN